MHRYTCDGLQGRSYSSAPIASHPAYSWLDMPSHWANARWKNLSASDSGSDTERKNGCVSQATRVSVDDYVSESVHVRQG